MIKRILTILILILPALAFPQRIENVKAGQEGKKIIIYYDLTGAQQGEKFYISVYCSTDGGNYFGNALRRVEGDVGDNITAGYNKRIIWDVFAGLGKVNW